jgi:hypothetical protein
MKPARTLLERIFDVNGPGGADYLTVERTHDKKWQARLMYWDGDCLDTTARATAETIDAAVEAVVSQAEKNEGISQ